jgi:hypothetical protein
MRMRMEAKTTTSMFLRELKATRLKSETSE